MSLLGYDAIGRWPLGTLPRGRQVVTLSAAAGAFSVSGVAALFKVVQGSATGTFAVSGSASFFKLSEPASVGAFIFNGQPASFKLTEQASTGAFGLSGNPVNERILFPDAPGAFIVSGQDANLVRTGDDYEFKLGGIGHFLEEIERQKQLNAITRKVPAPVDRRTIPRFAPLQAAPSAPAAPAPDMAAIQNQRMAEAARQAAGARRRRDEEALLLLAS